MSFRAPAPLLLSVALQCSVIASSVQVVASRELQCLLSVRMLTVVLHYTKDVSASTALPSSRCVLVESDTYDHNSGYDQCSCVKQQ
jgi:hypothetical protein